MLIVIGRKLNIELLNLYAVGVEVGFCGEIVIDDYFKMINFWIYLVGDVIFGF